MSRAKRVAVRGERMRPADQNCLRRLAAAYLEVCGREVQAERRRLWRKQNSLKGDRPLIYVRAFAWHEMPESRCTCEDAFLREYEDFFRRALFWDTLNDDSIFEPWVVVRAAHCIPPEGLWGLPIHWVRSVDPRGSRCMQPTLVNPADANRLTVIHHIVDEEETARRVDKLRDAIGDLLPIAVDRSPFYRSWAGDISTYLAQMRGIHQLMLDTYERPDWLHAVLAFMRDGILRVHEEAERAGDWKLCAHQNQAMPYADELADPGPDGASLTRDKLWYFCASQETTLWGPDMFDEFMFQYQMPIISRFGLAAYGCCEDLTRKIGVLRRLPNLRRIAVAPAADAAQCAEAIGRDYVLSYRPSPSDMVGYDFDANRIRRILKRDLGAARHCHVDITLKDVETVQQDPHRVRNWVAIAREVIDELWG